MQPLQDHDLLVKDDRLDGCVQSRSEHEEPKGHDEDIGDSLDGSEWGSPESTTIEVVVGHCPKDEAVERVESSRHDGQKVSHVGNDAMGSDEVYKMAGLTHFPRTKAIAQNATTMATHVPHPTTL